MTKDIINNIEVDECVKYDKEQYLSCNMHYCRCVEIPNCYFKQLKRAERENKRLLEIINAKPLETVDMDSAFEIEKLKEQLQAKEQECERLKRQNEMLSKNSAVQQWCDMYNKKDKECFDTLLKLAKVEQECKKLKKQYNCYACDTCNGKEDYKNMRRHCEKAISQIHKYQQAIDEIEEILNNGTADTQTNNAKLLHEWFLARFCDIRDIINKAKEQ